jgi:glycosyl transferase family 25
VTSRIPIRVINLDRDAERWRDTMQEFEAAGVGEMVERLPAVDGAAADFAAPGYAPHSWRDRWELKRSEQAVFESHRKAWQTIVRGRDAQGLVCEDDILVSPEFPKLLDVLDCARFGVVKLDGFSAERRYGAELDMNGWPVLEIVEPVPSAACYALSRAAAERLLADSATYCETLDDFVFRPRAGLQPVQLSPGVAVQRMCCEAAAETGESASLRERRDSSGATKGPLPYRVLKEGRRLLRRLQSSRATKRRPALAAGLPPFQG